MFTGWRGVHHASSAIAGFSAVLGEDGLSVRTYTENFFSSHLDEAGEPWGATRGPKGRRGQPLDGSPPTAVGSRIQISGAGKGLIFNPFPYPGIPHGGPLGRRLGPEAARADPEVPW